MVAEKTYIQVIVPLKLDWEPYYVLDEGESVCVGDFVAVPFAGRRYIGVVSASGVSLPVGMDSGTVKEIYSIHSEIPSLTESQLEFWRLIARYYMCTVGEVLKMASPAVKVSFTSTGRRRRPEKFMPPAEKIGLSASSLEYKRVVEASVGSVPVMLRSMPDIDALASLCSGKTGNVLWLVPDSVALKRLEAELRVIFGSKLLVFSQDMTASRRIALENSLKSSSSCLVIGTRAALFLPFPSLSMIIVQDEHSLSYKQSGIAPRFNARDAAVMLSGIHGAPLLLQSPTPSLESEFNCMRRKFKCVSVGRTPDDVLSDIETVIVDTRSELKKNGMAGDVPKMLLPQWRNDGEKIVFARFKKAFFPKSEDIGAQLCDLFGEEFFFSDDPVLRPVPENTRILCVFGTDSMLSKNDFRADERMLQELFGIIGPCRSSLRKLVILTRHPSHSVFHPDDVSRGLFDTGNLLAERKSLSLPPFSRMIDVRFREERGGDCSGRTERLREWLSLYIPSVSAQSYPFEDGWRVVLPKDKSLTSRKQALFNDVEAKEKELHCPNAVYFDVDP